MSILIILLYLSQLFLAYVNASEPPPSTNYTLYKTIPDTLTTYSIAFSPDYSVVLLYDRSRPAPPLIYSPFSWSQIKNDPRYFFKEAIFIEIFIDRNNATNIIYANADKQIRLRILTISSFREVILLKDSLKMVQKIILSDDKTRWAAISKGDQFVYWGNVTETPQQPQMYRNTFEAIIEDIAWRPEKQEIYLVLYKKQISLMSPVVLNIEKRIIEKIACELSATVSNLFFASKFILFYFGTQQSDGRLFRCDLYLNQSDSVPLLGIYDQMSLNGKLVSFLNPLFKMERLYTLKQIDKLNTDDFYFQENSQLTSSGLSPTNTFFIATSGQNLLVYKLCNSVGYYYDYGQEKCLTCQQPCYECLIAQNSCQSCINNSYFLDTANHRCLTCNSSMPHCQNCLNSSNCLICKQQYFLINNNSCKLCPQLIQGCILCQTSTLCQTCQPDYQLNPYTHRCQTNKNDLWMILMYVGCGVVLVCIVVFVILRVWKAKRRREAELRLKLMSSLVMEGSKEDDRAMRQGYLIPD